MAVNLTENYVEKRKIRLKKNRINFYIFRERPAGIACPREATSKKKSH